MEPWQAPHFMLRVYLELAIAGGILFGPTLFTMARRILDLRSGNPPSTEIYLIRSAFGHALQGGVALFCPVIVLFIIFSGLGAPYSAALEAFDYGMQHCYLGFLHDAGFELSFSYEQWQGIRLLLATMCSFVLAGMFWFLFAAYSLGGSASITVNPLYVQFPRRYMLPLRFRLRRSWDDLECLSVGGGKLVFRFLSGDQVTIGQAEITPENLDRLVRESMRFSGKCRFLGDVVPANPTNLFLDIAAESVDGSNAGLEIPSYTEIWDEEFRRSYHSTTFVPLQQNQCLSGKYSIVEHLASTAMSAAYIARDPEGYLVVVKEAAPSASPGEDTAVRQRLLKELEQLTKLDHPRISKVRDSFSERDRDYLVIEYRPGKNLRTYLADVGELSAELALQLALQMCDVLEYLHAQDPPVIHRDLSPDNWIVDARRRISLIDFGAATQYEADVTGTIVGKQAYIAPEQLRGRACTQSDIYSFGKTLAFLLTGSDPEPLCASHLVASHGGFSETLDSLVAECTQPDLDLRIKSVLELTARIKAALGAESKTEKGKHADDTHIITLSEPHTQRIER